MSGTLGERTLCEVDQETMLPLLTILSQVYSNSTRAVVREYAMNALESHIAAGQTCPVEVTLPKAENGFTFSVRDYGTGLSVDEMKSVYLQYKSTKREDAEAVGGLGIGSKSAWSISNQFVVTAVKDGFSVTAVLSMSGGMPGWNMMESTTTDKPNGVLVQVPVPLGENSPKELLELWRREANSVFSTWENGTVTVDGEHVKSIFDSAVKLTDDLYYSDVWRTDFHICAGGIAYPARGVAIGAPRGFILRMKVSEIDVAPDREGLRDTTKTVNNISTRLAESIRSAKEKFVDEFHSLPGGLDKIALYRANLAILGGSRLDLSVPQLGRYGVRIQGMHLLAGGKLNTEWRNVLIPFKVMDRSMVVVVGKWNDSSYYRRFIYQWAEANSGLNVCFVKSESDLGFIKLNEFDTVLTWDDFLAEAKLLARKSVAKKAPEPTYNVYVIKDGLRSSKVMSVSDIKELASTENVSLYYSNHYDTYSVFSHAHHDCIIVWLKANNTVKAMHKRFGELEQADEVAARLVQVALRNVTAEQRLQASAHKAMSRYSYVWRNITERFIPLVSQDSPVSKLVTEINDCAKSFNIKSVTEEVYNSLAIMPEHVLSERFPLLWYVASQYMPNNDALKELAHLMSVGE